MLCNDDQAEPQVRCQTTAAAIALLDAQFPWLREAEPRSGKRPQRAANEKQDR